MAQLKLGAVFPPSHSAPPENFSIETRKRSPWSDTRSDAGEFVLMIGVGGS
jgi:hypothetical protein